MEITAEPINTVEPIQEAITSYDPNINNGTHHVQLTFRMWNYATVHVVEVHGAMRGFDAMEYAIEDLYERLFESGADDGPVEVFRLINEKGETLVGAHADDIVQDFEWFKSLCVESKIVGHTPPDLM